MWAIKHLNSYLTGFFPLANNSKVDDKGSVEAIHSFYNKNNIPIDMFIVKNESNFIEDKSLYLKVYQGFDSAKQKFFDNGSEYLDHFFDNLAKDIQSQEAIYLRAFVNNRLVGCVSYDLNWKKNDSNWERNIYLNHIFIDPDFQNTGIGKELIFSVFKDSKITSRFESIIALVEWYSLNDPTKFYKKIGFQEVDSIDFPVNGTLYKWVKNS